MCPLCPATATATLLSIAAGVASASGICALAVSKLRGSNTQSTNTTNQK